MTVVETIHKRPVSEVVDVSEFDKVLEESEQASREVLRECEQTWNEMQDKVDDVEGIEVQATNTDILRFSHKAHKHRKKDKSIDNRLELFGGSIFSRPACHIKAAVYAFEKIGYKPKWAVSACVLLREQGVCGVCGEPIMGHIEVKMVLPKARGGEFEEKNCVSVCRYCGECWFPHKEFFGLTIKDMFENLCHAVMERRHRQFHGVKDLTDKSLERFRWLGRQIEKRNKHLNTMAGKALTNSSFSE